MNTASICNVLPEGRVPESVQLLPAGPEIEGRDGRKWRLESAAEVAAASLDGSKDLPIDYEHATEIKAPEGDPAPAVGWIKSLHVRNGELWGDVEWTMEGAAMIAARKYRYLSPVFEYEKGSSRIVRLTSAALTNQPNLRMTALNREGPGIHKDILEALDLDEDASGRQVVDAVEKLLQERRAAVPEGFVLRQDHDAMLTRALDAEATLEASDAMEYERERAALRNGRRAAAAARNEEERTMTQHEITQEIKRRARKLVREMGGTMSLMSAVQSVAPDVMRDAASPAPPAIEQPSERAARQSAREQAQGLDKAYGIVDAARAYQREQAKRGRSVNYIEAVNHVHVTSEAAA